jgi:hypothetical protein
MFVAGVDAYSKVGLEDLAAGGVRVARAFQSRRQPFGPVSRPVKGQSVVLPDVSSPSERA